MSSSPVNHLCLVCRQPTSKWCSRCQTAWYCSRDHMEGDWPRHRQECYPPSAVPAGYGSDMIATPPPAEPEYILVPAILFLAEEDRPQIVNVKCRSPHRPSHDKCPVPLLHPHFDSPPESVVLTQGLNDKLLRFPLHVFYSPIALSRASPINRSIYHITLGATPRSWCGNVVVLKFNGSRRQGYSDTSSNDLPALSAYFLSYQ
ncbi:hypothetical protein B0H11DRAFT_2093498 [Mycena galericulata]|nr:hypothetical protein B0H11DRAFT_2093498 [Mycena galericulata]